MVSDPTPAADTAPTPPRDRRAVVIALVIFVAAAALISWSDLWSKEVIFDYLEVKTDMVYDANLGREKPRVSLYKPSGEKHRIWPPAEQVIDGCFKIEVLYNDGAYGGWLKSVPNFLVFISLAALVVILAIALWHLYHTPKPEWMFVLALGLLWGGTLGNLYDRWVFGGVRDWIRWYVFLFGRDRGINNFNIADAAICTGVGLILLRELLLFLRHRREAKASSAA